MEFTLTLDHGPLQAEVTGEEREEVKEEFLEFSSFFQEHEQEIMSLLDQSDEGVRQTPATGWQGVRVPEGINDALSPVVERTHVEIEVLSELVDILTEEEGDEEEKVPRLNLHKLEEEAEVLGSSRKDRQARGSLMLLYLWKKCLDVDDIESGKLNTALSYSEINPQRRDAMYSALDGNADGYFNRNGLISLTPTGEHAAREEIKLLAEAFGPEQDEL